MNEIQELYHNRNLKKVAYGLNPHLHAFLHIKHLPWYGVDNRSESMAKTNVIQPTGNKFILTSDRKTGKFCHN